MKASRFSDAEKAFILKQSAGGVPVADICRKAGISQATYSNWKKEYDVMLPQATVRVVKHSRIRDEFSGREVPRNRTRVHCRILYEALPPRRKGSIIVIAMRRNQVDRLEVNRCNPFWPTSPGPFWNSKDSHHSDRQDFQSLSG